MLVKLAFVMQRLKKISEKNVWHDQQNKDRGAIFSFYGGDIELMGRPPVPPLGKTLISDRSEFKTLFTQGRLIQVNCERDKNLSIFVGCAYKNFALDAVHK